MRQRFAGREGLARFSDVVTGSLVDQDLRPATPEGFDATLAAAAVGDARLVSASVGPIRARRRDGAGDATGSVFLLLARRGHGRIAHRCGHDAIDRRRLVVVPGAEPFEVEYAGPASLLFVALPAPVVARSWPGLDGPVRSVPLGGVAGPVAAQLPFVLSAALASGPADGGDLALLLDSSLHLMLRDAVGDTAGSPVLVLRLAAERLVERHLDDPQLSVPWLAWRLSVSVRQLHRAFATGRVTPAEHVRRRRLAACARALADTSASVSDLAARYGFASASHLGAAFRSAYGETPGAWRARHAADRDPSATW